MLDLERIEYLISENATLAEPYPIHKEVAAALPTLIAAAKRERVLYLLLARVVKESYIEDLYDKHMCLPHSLYEEIQEALK